VKLIDALFTEDPRKGLLRYKDELDEIKKRAAGLARAELLSGKYTLARYSVFTFAFQQYFHSSYRARQGNVLENTLEVVLSNFMNIAVIKGKSRRKKFIRNLYNIKSTKDLPDIDILITKDQKGTKRILIMQIRSTDVTGGTTAKGSLVDLLLRILEKAENIPETLYIITVWEPGFERQKNSLINKVWERVKRYIGENFEQEFKNDIERGFKIPNRSITIQLVYGANRLSNILGEFVEDDKVPVVFENTWNMIKNWDDLWLTYAITSLELENILINNVSNAILLEEYMEEADIELRRSDLEDYQNRSKEIALKLILKWEKDTLPVKKPSDVVNYIRDLVLLKMIHYGIQENIIDYKPTK